MTTEIELKFVINEQATADLTPFLSQWPAVYVGQHRLLNTYYETKTYLLRHHDMGLRIRTCDDRHEMTLKTSGRVIAGLHQRPEYNISLTKPALQLSLFPEGILPEGIDIGQLEGDLNPLFSTNFTRDRWLITFAASEIELALDRGEIDANQTIERINEVELELKRGSVSDMLVFAQQFCLLGGLRLSNQSKAARGYRLAQRSPVEKTVDFAAPCVAENATIEQALLHSTEAILAYWQRHEEIWLTGDKKAKHALEKAIELLRQVWIVWENIVPRKATADLRKQLQQLAYAIEDEGCSVGVCERPLYVQTKLALTQWAVDKHWRTYLAREKRSRLNGSFKRFADVKLSQTANALKKTFTAHLTDQARDDQIPFLKRQIMSLLLLASAYPSGVSNAYIRRWQRLYTALSHNPLADKAELTKRALTQPLFWQNGLKR